MAGVTAPQQRTRTIGALSIYTVCVSATGVVLLALSLSRLPSSLPGILVFIGLGLIAELTTSESIAPQIAF